jgi:hypothetical protein
MKKLIPALLILISFSLVMNSCKKDKGDPPLLPPYETMLIDFSNFAALKKSAEAYPVTKGTESSTWQFAANLASVWNSLLADNCVIPLAAYLSATTNKAAYVSQNVWQWSYNFNPGATAYKARLQAKNSTSSVTWKLYVTLEGTGGFKDFLWVEGTSKADGSQGQWKFHLSPSSDVQIFQVDWSKSGDEVTEVIYKYTKNDTFKDSYINYHLNSSGFDAGYLIHFADGSFSDSQIEWNLTTHDGRLKCVDYLQDENWYCWDNNKINKICD